jgi:propionyl-CoA carboxylase alpha chain
MRFSKVLIANRGEIARRVIQTCRSAGYQTVAVFSEADAGSPCVEEADEAIELGPAPVAESYLDASKIVRAAKRSGAQAIHPGYGFLSENADFAQACADNDIVFIGPSPDAIRAMGSKIQAKALMARHGVPVIPGYSGEDQSPAVLAAKALEIGFPVLLKASAGGGGKGMRVVREESSLLAGIESAAREASSAFGDGTLLIEKYIERPRHIEFQIVGDEHGNVIHCFERECSIQRRHQKIIEETPSLALTDALRSHMAAAAVNAGKALGYSSAGTVEFILGPDGAFYFLEVNTRLQVEHPVTEETTGLDLVAMQLHVAQGRVLPVTQDEVEQRGHSIECRIYAEDPANDFLPCIGQILHWDFPPSPGLRLDSGVRTGSDVGIHYDPMLAKVITVGETREEATARMVYALSRSSIVGVKTNRAFLLNVLRHPRWEKGDLDTHFIDDEYPPEKRNTSVAEADVRLALLVATVGRAHRRHSEREHLPSLPFGFRNNRWRDSEERWERDDVVHEVFYAAEGRDSYRVLLGDERVRVTIKAFTEPKLRLDIDGHVRDYLFVDSVAGGDSYVQVGETLVTLRHTERFPGSEDEEEETGCLAPMPGKVLRVSVSVGDRVDEGQTLVVLEAMKMEHAIASPRAGVVAEVLVAEGELVEAQSPLFELEEETA